MTQHTPGPWLVEPHGQTVALYSRRDYGQHGLRLMNLDDGDANFKANASLIAAAPDLLDALKSMIEVSEEALGRLDGHDRGMVGGEPAIARARAAIAKATGEA